jgi:hypothetical protein
MTTTYTFDQLKEDVQKEAEALRVHATKEERERLDIETLNPAYSSECIYGQMCESCRSERAVVLIKNCCTSFIRNSEFMPITGGTNWNDAHALPSKATSATTVEYLSAIEAYIIMPEANNANLIAYLRGETETLEL